jgi:hypothetical protein
MDQETKRRRTQDEDGAPGSLVSIFPRFSDFVLATSHSSLATIFNHSRTYARRARKSNHSRTYGKHGGGGAFCEMSSPITPLFSFTMLTILSIAIVGAPTFPFLHARRRAARLGRTGPTNARGCRFRNALLTPLPLFPRLHL